MLLRVFVAHNDTATLARAAVHTEHPFGSAASWASAAQSCEVAEPGKPKPGSSGTIVPRLDPSVPLPPASGDKFHAMLRDTEKPFT